MGSNTKEHHVDALVVGAGFSGIYQLCKLRELGLRVKAIDAAPGVGGVWYSNRYPGATTDTQSEVFRYTWDLEDLQTYRWEHRYLPQSETLGYLKHIAERHDLAKDIQLNTRMESAQYVDNAWRVNLSTGETYVTRYLATALGNLSKIYYPNIPGVKSFAGETYHTADWPNHHDFKGKRVGIIGNGSTGVQLIVALADQAKSLVSFQRHPQYVVPNGDGPVSDDYRRQINSNYPEIVDRIRNNWTGLNFSDPTVSALGVSAEERNRMFENVWESGNGFNFMFGTFNDIVTDAKANKMAADFISGKIAQIVKDPVKARKLTPTGQYNRRPVTTKNYYETFNRDNVDVANVLETPMEITPTGVRLSDGTIYDLDVLVFATGFEAVVGQYKDVAIQGRNGKYLLDHWADGTKAHLGITISGFPNLFLLNGPLAPLSSVPPLVEVEVEYVTDLIAAAEVAGKKKASAPTVEVKQEEEDAWSMHVREVAKKTVFTGASSWLVGENVEGGGSRNVYYFGGLHTFRKALEDEAKAGYPSFKSFC
ncbi:hypothetical protein V8C42DRAFT_189563 [Trichoderma barbatum]